MKVLSRILICCSILAVTLGARPFADTTPAPAPALSPAEKARVDGMGVVVREVANLGKPGKTYDAIALMRGTLDQAYAVLSDYERYPEFMPNVSATEIVERKDNETTVNYTLKLPLGKIKKYRLKLWSERSENKLRIFWTKVPWEGLKDYETIADTVGNWTVVPADKEGYLLAVHHVYTDPGKIPAGLGWIVDILTKDSLPNVLNATRKRIESLYFNKKE
ncbi:MAG: hypothetical protein HZB26_13570 [Candidatus Hydrogenedentes bacterium]|nr:hypothetical protein [Candidatus Hydrogenedentota bacterium]